MLTTAVTRESTAGQLWGAEVIDFRFALFISGLFTDTASEIPDSCHGFIPQRQVWQRRDANVGEKR